MSLLDCNKFQSDDYLGEIKSLLPDMADVQSLLLKCLAEGDIITQKLETLFN